MIERPGLMGMNMGWTWRAETLRYHATMTAFCQEASSDRPKKMMIEEIRLGVFSLPLQVADRRAE